MAQELLRSGVHHACIAPGSRSGPLVLALHEERTLRLTTHLDERAMGYFALGAAKATDRPVAMVTTSGTAVANLLPAIVEARHALVPLIVLTADRPPELVGVGANQAIDQARIFGSFPRSFADAGVPEPLVDRVRHLRTLVNRLVSIARGPPAGPVHLNLPFREPIEPTSVAEDVAPDWALTDPDAEAGRRGGGPWTRMEPPQFQPDPTHVADVARLLAAAPDGIIVCGPRSMVDDLPGAVLELARATGYCVLADPLSGVRFGAPDGAIVLSGYDAFLAHAPTRDRLRPQVILRFGAAPTSKSLLAWMNEAHDAQQVWVDEHDLRQEPTLRVDHILPGHGPTIARQLADAVQAPPARNAAWRRAWGRLESTTWDVLGPELARRPFEGGLAARLLDALPPNAVLYVSSSLPIRDVDRFGRGGPKPLRILANRGASGIDGVTSSALGVAYGLGRAVTLLIGDLAFLHDLSGLVAARRLGLELHVVLVNNDGGGIFEFLPIAQQEPPFTELFVTPHGLDARAMAQALGFAYDRSDIAELTPARLAAPSAARSILEVNSDRKKNLHHRRALDEALAPILDAALEDGARAN